MKTTLGFAGAVVLSLISAGASAQGWIAGGAVGQATQEDYSVPGGFTKSDDSDTAFRLFGGYLVSPRQGIIASWIDLGTTAYEGPAFGEFSDSFDSEGIDVSYIIGWAPGSQERLSLFGTVGVYAWDQNVSLIDGSGVFRAKNEGTSFSFSIGADFNMSSGAGSAWSIHAQWQVLKDIGDVDSSGVEADHDVVTVGLSYRFGRNQSAP